MGTEPNIILLMVDQQRWDAIGSVDPRVKTPTIDQLVADGVHFTEATCQAPMCVPSRASLMYSMYPSTTGIRSNAQSTPDDGDLPNVPLPETLRNAGYLTAGFGKTHWGITEAVPSTRGFDVRVVGTQDLGIERGATGWQEDDDPVGRSRYLEMTRDYGPGEEEAAGYLGATSSIPERNHPDGWIAERAIEWLEGPGPSSDRPLFFYLSFVKPHAAHNPPAEFESMYDIDEIPDLVSPPWGPDRYDHVWVRDSHSPFHGERSSRWRSAWAQLTNLERRWATLRYWANCTWIDSLIGRALTSLERRGKLDNAMIVFCSDHGDMLGERNYLFSKYCLYEGSVRVPLVLSGTGVPTALRGTQDARAAELVDIYPTLAAAAGATVGPQVVGHSLMAQSQRSGSFAEMHEPAPAWMWRTPTHKLIVFIDPDRTDVQGELYDLRADPMEWRNLFYEDSHLALRAELASELIGHVAKVNARWPVH